VKVAQQFPQLDSVIGSPQLRIVPPGLSSRMAALDATQRRVQGLDDRSFSLFPHGARYPDDPGLIAEIAPKFALHAVIGVRVEATTPGVEPRQ